MKAATTHPQGDCSRPVIPLYHPTRPDSARSLACTAGWARVEALLHSDWHQAGLLPCSSRGFGYCASALIAASYGSQIELTP